MHQDLTTTASKDRRQFLARLGAAAGVSFLAGCGGGAGVAVAGDDGSTAVSGSTPPPAPSTPATGTAPVPAPAPAQLPEPGSSPVPPAGTVAAPGWRRGMGPWQWLELPSADLAAVGPDHNPGNGYRSARINAWNGMTALGSQVCMAGVGGHADWAGNEAYRCDLSQDMPAWEMLCQPTADEFLVRDEKYYRDGRPTSSHTYYALHADRRRSKIFRLGIGSAYGTGNFQRPTVDAFDLTVNDWDPEDTWPEAPDSLGIGMSQTQNPQTGDVYVVGRTRLWRFRMESGTWTALASMPQNGTAAYYRASAVDVQRQRVVIFGNQYETPVGILIYDIASNTWLNASLTGAMAEMVAAQAGHCAFYAATQDRFLLKTSRAGEVVEIHPESFETRAVLVSGADAVPNAVNGVFGKFVHVPALGGFGYQPDGRQKLWFLADGSAI